MDISNLGFRNQRSPPSADVGCLLGPKQVHNVRDTLTLTPWHTARSLEP